MNSRVATLSTFAVCLSAALWAVVASERANSQSTPAILPPQVQAASTQGSSGMAESTEAAKVAAWIKALPPVSPERNHFSLLGGGLAMLSGEAIDAIRLNGPAAFYADPLLAQRALLDLDQKMNREMPFFARGGLLYLRSPLNVIWGMMEVRRGQMEWAVSDSIVSQVEAQGLSYVGTVAPLADWDLAGLPPPNPSNPGYQDMMRLLKEMFFLTHGGRMGIVQDVDAFISFLRQAVGRYGAARPNDVPRLPHGIKYWQLDNEPENWWRAQDFAAFMRRGYQAVHAACPDCQVLNGGGYSFDQSKPDGDFWYQFAAAGGADSVDIIALHYNRGKEGTSSISEFESLIRTIRQLLGPQKPVWLTEFGVVLSVTGSFATMSETEAGAWFMRFYTAGLANGVQRFFSDLGGFYDKDTVRLPFYVNKLLEDKLGRFQTAEKLAEGQYRFSGFGPPVYVLWKGVPPVLQRTRVTATDMYGQIQVAQAEDLKPSESSPLIVEQGAPPAPFAASINNAASFASGPLAPGSWATVFGSNLSGHIVSVTVDGIAAQLSYTDPTQINFLIPSQLGSKSSAQMVVAVDGQESAPVGIALTITSPGIFTPGILNQDSSINSSSNPAALGSVIQIYLTGLNIPNGWIVTVDIGDRFGLPPLYAGPAPGLLGLQQVNVTIPGNLSAARATVDVCVSEIAGARKVCSPNVNLSVVSTGGVNQSQRVRP